MVPTFWYFGGRAGSSLWLQLDLKSKEWWHMRWRHGEDQVLGGPDVSCQELMLYLISNNDPWGFLRSDHQIYLLEWEWFGHRKGDERAVERSISLLVWDHFQGADKSLNYWNTRGEERKGWRQDILKSWNPKDLVTDRMWIMGNLGKILAKGVRDNHR